MPSRTRDGRQVGGAEKERRKKARLEAERKRPAAPAQPSGGLSGLPAPPESTAHLIRWGARILAGVMHRAAQDGTIFETERDQLRFLADCCAKLGMIRDKAAEQELIDKRLAEIDGEQNKSSGLEAVRGLKAPKISRPSS